MGTLKGMEFKGLKVNLAEMATLVIAVGSVFKSIAAVVRGWKKRKYTRRR